jgi:hypothetical protein
MDVAVPLQRPAADGETLWAMLHTDDGNGMYDGAATDAPVEDGGMVVQQSFDVTVAAGTPDVRITITNDGVTDYDFLSIEPDIEPYSDDIGGGGTDPTLELEDGRRYEILNEATMNHPFEFIEKGASAAVDTVRASQQTDPAFENNPQTDWVEDGNSIFFTVSNGFQTNIDGYRCAIHIVAMRGDVTYP